MNIKTIYRFRFPGFVRMLGAVMLSSMLLASCSDWTRTESLPFNPVHPWESEPGRWDAYLQDLRAYKAGPHRLTYIAFDNGEENPVSEGDCLRSLPDSLDIVSLRNPDRISRFDAEDFGRVRNMGTRVLCHIDLTTAAETDTAVETAIQAVKKYGLDGYSFTGRPHTGDEATETLSRNVVERLSSAMTDGQMLICDGDPSFVTREDIERIDFFVIPTQTAQYMHQLKDIFLAATDWGVKKEKILLNASMEASWFDADNKEYEAVPKMVENVIAFGPLAGLAVTDVRPDYYDYEGNWLTIRSAISRLNP